MRVASADMFRANSRQQNYERKSRPLSEPMALALDNHSKQGLDVVRNTAPDLHSCIEHNSFASEDDAQRGCWNGMFLAAVFLRRKG
jgi:hypothetical protein